MAVLNESYLAQKPLSRLVYAWHGVLPPGMYISFLMMWFDVIQWKLVKRKLDDYLNLILDEPPPSDSERMKAESHFLPHQVKLLATEKR